MKHIFLKVKTYKADTVCQVNPPKVSEPKKIIILTYSYFYFVV